MSWFQKRFAGKEKVSWTFATGACLVVGSLARRVSPSSSEVSVQFGEWIGFALVPAGIGAVIGLIVWAVKGKSMPPSILIPECIFYTAIVMMIANGFLLFTR
jgi:hypothetical protein